MYQSRPEVDRANRELRTLCSHGQILYNSVQRMVELRDHVRTWITDLGVQVEFSPHTPADLQDYLAAGSLGAIEGAFAGGMLGLIFGTLLGSPATGLALGEGLGAVAGAALAIDSVKCGLRVRIHARRTVSGMQVALVEAL